MCEALVYSLTCTHARGGCDTARRVERKVNAPRGGELAGRGWHPQAVRSAASPLDRFIISIQTERAREGEPLPMCTRGTSMYYVWLGKGFTTHLPASWYLSSQRRRSVRRRQRRERRPSPGEYTFRGPPIPSVRTYTCSVPGFVLLLDVPRYPRNP